MRRAASGPAAGAMPGGNGNAPCCQAQGKPLSFPSPLGSLPRAHRSRLQTTTPSEREGDAGSAGKAERGPGDVDPVPGDSRNPTQGRSAVANWERGKWGGWGGWWCVCVCPEPHRSAPPHLPGRFATAFRSKSRCSTCPAGRAAAFPCPGARPCPGDTAAGPLAPPGLPPDAYPPSAAPPRAGSSARCPAASHPTPPPSPVLSPHAGLARRHLQCCRGPAAAPRRCRSPAARTGAARPHGWLLAPIAGGLSPAHSAAAPPAAPRAAGSPKATPSASPPPPAPVAAPGAGPRPRGRSL